MTHENLNTLIRRNKLLGVWAAKRLGLTAENAEVYSNDLAKCTLDSERSDVLCKVRSDFKDAGLVLSDDETLRVTTEFWLEASRQGHTSRGDASDAAVVQIARNFMSR